MPELDLEELTDEEVMELFQKAQKRTPKGKKNQGYPYPYPYPYKRKKGYYPYYPYYKYPYPRYEEPNVLFCVNCGYIDEYAEGHDELCPECEAPLLLGYAVSQGGIPYKAKKGKLTKPEEYPTDKGYPYYKLKKKKKGEDEEDEEIFILPLEFNEGEEDLEDPDLQTFALETKELTDVEIFEVGTHNGDEYTEDDLDDMVKNFKTLKGKVMPPFKLGHMNEKEQKQFLPKGMPAIGWIEDIKRKGKKLLGSIKQVPKRVAELVEAGAYKRISPEIYVPYKDQSGKVYKKVLAAVVLLGADIPAVKTLPAIEKLYNENSESNTTKFYGGGIDEMGDTPEELQQLREKITELENSVKEKDGKLGEMTEAMKTKDEALREAAEEKRKTEIKAFVDSMKAAGKVIPVFENPLVLLLESADTGNVIKFTEEDNGEKKERELSQLDLIKEMVGKFPKMIELQELSSSEDGEVVITQKKEADAKKEYGVKEDDGETLEGLELHALAEKVAEEKKIPYADALVQVSKTYKEQE